MAVDFQLIWTLSQIPMPQKETVANAFLTRLYRDGHPGVTKTTNQQDASSWFLPALMNSLGNDPVEVLRRATTASALAFPLPTVNAADTRPPLPPPSTFTRSQLEMVSRFSRLVGARNISNEVVRALQILEHLPANSSGGPVFTRDLRIAWEFAGNLQDGLAESGSSLQRYGAIADLKQVFRSAKQVAFGSPSAATDDRLGAIKAVACDPDRSSQSNLLGLVLSGSESLVIQKAALSALARPGVADFAPDLLKRWPLLTPALRVEVLELSLRRRERIRALLSALEKGIVRPAEVSITQQAFLRSHQDQALREQAAKILGQSSFSSRQSAVESFRPALGLTGVGAAGQKTFQARCALCHRLAGQGQALGPDLASVRANGKEKLLTSIVDPNGEVAPQFVSYLIETKDGESLAGIIVIENATSVTLRMAGGMESVVARANIASLQSQGKSLMPEGLEEGLTAQDMADLLEFIVAP
jgi:putative heme-binding domain-containing protein